MWEKQGNESGDFRILPYSGPSYGFTGALEEHAGVYYAYWKDFRPSNTGSLFRLIVRSKYTLNALLLLRKKTESCTDAVYQSSVLMFHSLCPSAFLYALQRSLQTSGCFCLYWRLLFCKIQVLI